MSAHEEDTERWTRAHALYRQLVAPMTASADLGPLLARRLIAEALQSWGERVCARNDEAWETSTAEEHQRLAQYDAAARAGVQ